MPQEFEMKYAIPDQAAADGIVNELERAYGKAERIEMSSEYYDTGDRFLRSRGITLRRRHENGECVFCYKQGNDGVGAVHVRTELEVRCEGLEEALGQLRGQGADLDFSGRLIVIVSLSFIRRRVYAAAGETKLEIAVDCGRFGTCEEFFEIEFELKSGAQEAARAFSETFAAERGLIPQPISKLGRAIRVMEKKPVNPFYLTASFLDYCIKQGYVFVEVGDDNALTYFITPEGEEQLNNKFNIQPQPPCCRKGL